MGDRKAVGVLTHRVTEMAQSAICMAVACVAESTGIFTILAKNTTPGTPSTYLTVNNIAEKGRLQPRYVLEICASLTFSGLISYDMETDKFYLDQAQRTVLNDPSFPLFQGGWFDILPALYQTTPILASATKDLTKLTGVPYEVQSKLGFSTGMDRMNAPGIKRSLVKKWLPQSAPHLVQRMKKGAKVADLGCGQGALALTLAKAFPTTTVDGIDIDKTSIAAANKQKAQQNLNNVTFKCVNMGAIPSHTYDIVFNHDCIHDLADPEGALRAICKSLKKDGTFFSMEPKTTGETLQECYKNTMGSDAAKKNLAFMYGMSTLHCTTVSCAQGGPGLGCATFGPKKYETLATRAGFTNFTLVGSNMLNNFYTMAPKHSSL
eukprot:m.101092 g.101092  ORF g.101092 m.101092 type:complete len:378 (-) comp13733_c0_seq4:84-1217(-)